jgi:hypothetical protein
MVGAVVNEVESAQPVESILVRGRKFFGSAIQLLGILGMLTAVAWTGLSLISQGLGVVMFGAFFFILGGRVPYALGTGIRNGSRGATYGSIVVSVLGVLGGLMQSTPAEPYPVSMFVVLACVAFIWIPAIVFSIASQEL